MQARNLKNPVSLNSFLNCGANCTWPSMSSRLSTVCIHSLYTYSSCSLSPRTTPFTTTAPYHAMHRWGAYYIFVITTCLAKP